MRLIGSATLLVVLLALVQVADPLQTGLTATHFSDTNWSSTPARMQVDRRPSTDRLFAAWRGSPPDSFSATWRGSFITFRSGTYTFAASSDDGSWVYVDGQLVVENAGRHAAREARGTIALDRGVHSIFIKYFQEGGALAFELGWARNDGPVEPIPSWALVPRAVEFRRMAASVVARRGLTLALWLWLAAVVAVAIKKAADDFRTVRLGAEHALFAVGAFTLLFVLPHEISGDGRARFLALAQLIEWHELSATAYSMVGPLLSAPLYLIGTVFLGPEWWCARFNTIVFLTGLWVAGHLLRGRIDDDVRNKFLLLILACSMYPTHLEGYFAEAFTATVVAIGLLAVDGGSTMAGWAAAIVGVVNTPAALLALGAAGSTEAWATRRLRHLVPVAVAASLILAESWIRRGSPFITGYEGNHGDTTVLTYSGRPGFSYPFAFGVLSILLSFGKGLAFYTPGLFLPVAHRRRFHALWLAFVAGLIAIYAKWWAWFGGLFWGPRFFVFASFPASLALATWLARARELSPARRALLLGVLTLSAWAAVDGVVFGYSGLGACRDPNHEWLCLYVPEFSALWRPFVEWTTPSASRLTVGAYITLVYGYLLIPLATLLKDDVRAAWQRWTAALLDRGPWRF